MTLPALNRVGPTCATATTPRGTFYYSYNTCVAFKAAGDMIGVKLDHKFSVTTSKHMGKMGCGGFPAVSAKKFAEVIGYTGDPDNLTQRQ